MPIYEYHCPSCNSQFELLRPMSKADEGVSCPSCNNGAQKVISTFTSFSKESDGSTVPMAGSGVT